MFALLFALQSFADAAELSGVNVPDTATVGGQQLVLNGLGLREKFFFDIYVGGLYLPSKTSDWKAAIEMDGAKRITMNFVYSEVSLDKLLEAYKEGLESNSYAANQGANFEKFFGWMETMKSGDSMVFDYVPGTGTTVTVKGQVKGTIADADFMKALWAVYIGDHPPTNALKSGMMKG
ncbi:MAG: chalcone isomerase family protein [Alphaproteobacteria bacterium]|nr:chalcone isomerase family protein [Alphaproteobacteria bacterium]MCB9698030.1 chalcone isomerase family protein [Alphaproteobacteria bacterium]